MTVEDSTNLTCDYVIAKEGDTLLTADRTSFRVESSMLRLVSPVWRDQLDPTKLKGTQNYVETSPIPFRLYIREYDMEDVELMLRIFHLQFEHVPLLEQTVPSKLFSMSILARKYNCYAALRLFLRQGLEFWVKAAENKDSKYNDDFNILVATYIVNEAELFKRISKRLLLDTGGLYGSIQNHYENSEASVWEDLPLDVIGLIEDHRAQVRQDIQLALLKDLNWWAATSMHCVRHNMSKDAVVSTLAVLSKAYPEAQRMVLEGTLANVFDYFRSNTRFGSFFASVSSSVEHHPAVGEALDRDQSLSSAEFREAITALEHSCNGLCLKCIENDMFDRNYKEPSCEHTGD